MLNMFLQIILSVCVALSRVGLLSQKVFWTRKCKSKCLCVDFQIVVIMWHHSLPLCRTAHPHGTPSEINQMQIPLDPGLLCSRQSCVRAVDEPLSHIWPDDMLNIAKIPAFSFPFLPCYWRHLVFPNSTLFSHVCVSKWLLETTLFEIGPVLRESRAAISRRTSYSGAYELRQCISTKSSC